MYYKFSDPLYLIAEILEPRELLVFSFNSDFTFDLVFHPISRVVLKIK